MAVDSFIDSLKLNNGLTSIANAIRAKSGISTSLTFPQGFVNAINNISSGGEGAMSTPLEAVNFYDYDGSIVYSYSAEDFITMSSMPPNPDHSQDMIPLTSQGWNWELSEAKAYVAKYGMLNIGQVYIPTDGCTHIKINIKSNMFEQYNTYTLHLQVNGTISVGIDWGDGQMQLNSLNGNGIWQVVHTYNANGQYDISIRVSQGTIKFFGNSKGAGVIAQAAYMMNTIDEIYLGNNVEIDDTYVFKNCKNLKIITIPNGITQIKANSFQGCSSLKNIIIPSGVTSIGSSAFSDCFNLINASIPNSVTTINSSAFDLCMNLTTITIPEDNLETIGNDIFDCCYNLLIAVHPFSIGNGQFYGCIRLKNIKTSIEKMINIGSEAFASCFHLPNFLIPNNATTIESSTYSYCESIANITIPNSVTTIKSYAFYECTGLINVTIPNNVTSIESQAFYNCHGVMEYHILPTTPPTLGTDVFTGIDNGGSCIIYVPQGTLETYKTATNWSTYASYMREEPA